MRHFALILALLIPTTTLADTGPSVARMQADWAEYDAACRGTTPDQGSIGFCGARSYISWALTREGICLSDGTTPDTLWVPCTAAGAYPSDDPIDADLRDAF